MGLTVAETEVFNDTAPNVWTDLNLSGTVGAQATLVLLKVSGTNTGTVAVRKNGDTDEFYSVIAAGVAGGLTLADVQNGLHCALLVATDDSGIIEWKCEAAEARTVDVIAYFK